MALKRTKYCEHYIRLGKNPCYHSAHGLVRLKSWAHENSCFFFIKNVAFLKVIVGSGWSPRLHRTIAPRWVPTIQDLAFGLRDPKSSTINSPRMDQSLEDWLNSDEADVFYIKLFVLCLYHHLLGNKSALVRIFKVESFRNPTQVAKRKEKLTF